MDIQYGSSISSSKTGIDAGYNNYNSAGVKEDTTVQKGNEGARDIQQIPVGKAFRGEVTDVVGNKVSIRLENGHQLQARLSEPVNLNIGDKALFQVKSNGDGVIEIKPVIPSMQGVEATILKALQAAKLPINEKTVVMLQNLLQEQMPIDKNSLLNMYKQILANNQTDISTIVKMNKWQIPVTKENIGQFEAYKNYEHRISTAADNLSTQLSQLLQEVAKENPSMGKQFHMELLQLFVGEQSSVSEAESSLLTSEAPVNAGEVLQNAGQSTGQNTVMAEGMQEVLSDFGEEGNIPGNLSGNGESNANTAVSTNVDSASAAMGEQRTAFSEGQIGHILSREQRENLLNAMRELPLSEETKNQIISGKATVEEVLKELYTLLKQNTQFSGKELLQSEEYGKLLRTHINKQWFVKPEQLASGERMEEFYERLKTQTQQLEQMMNSIGRGDSAAAKTATGMKENIDFMNQINQMFTYVQIPLKMSGKTAHSDLYVFTKKRSLQEREGKVSALLHLDMDELGSLDIYVELDGSMVNTQFKLPSEELVQLFEQNIDFLTKRITEKGYVFSSKVEISNQQENNVEEFVTRDHGNVPMRRFAFDVRA